MVEDRLDLGNKEDKTKFKKIQAKYKRLVEEHKAEIKNIFYICVYKCENKIYSMWK